MDSLRPGCLRIRPPCSGLGWPGRCAGSRPLVQGIEAEVVDWFLWGREAAVTSRERVEAAPNHREPNRTPVFEYVLLPPLAEQLLGRPYADYAGRVSFLHPGRGHGGTSPTAGQDISASPKPGGFSHSVESPDFLHWLRHFAYSQFRTVSQQSLKATKFRAEFR